MDKNCELLFAEDVVNWFIGCSLKLLLVNHSLIFDFMIKKYSSPKVKIWFEPMFFSCSFAFLSGSAPLIPVFSRGDFLAPAGGEIRSE